MNEIDMAGEGQEREAAEVEVVEQDLPSLKRILGSLLFGAPEPVTISALRSALVKVAERDGGGPVGSDSEIRAELERLKSDLAALDTGLVLTEIAGGFRLVTDPSCGTWVRALLNLDKPARLSRPALETLAIIAFRQPVTRPEIEAVRGVNVDSIMRNLLEMQLIRIMGRSELPGRPVLYGTTQLFLEHFGLNDLKELPGVDELRRRERAEGAGSKPQPAAGEQPRESKPLVVTDEPKEQPANGEQAEPDLGPS